jgi:hypothetical protein
MAVEVAASGTQTAVVGTEHSLSVQTGAKSYMAVVDVGVMLNGDEVELRAKVKVVAAGTRKLLDMVVLQHAQPEPVTVFGPYPAGVDIEFSVKQTAGTGRAFDWAVWSV